MSRPAHAAGATLVLVHPYPGIDLRRGTPRSVGEAPEVDSLKVSTLAAVQPRDREHLERRARYGRFQRFFRLTTILLDLTLINLAFVIAYNLRYVLAVGGEVADVNFVELDVYLPIQAALSVILLACYSLYGLY